ncbi:MAG: hypothetical protein BMS9Abin06_0012 [Gammaproteobacteria bacterium]|nr:MAG: hypothetical protein BMS9Abin06_0012 [Gammaproteobacteria bacterium]
MSNTSKADNAEKRKEKLAALRARRLSQAPALSEDETEQRNGTAEADSEPGKKGGLRKRLVRALVKRRKQGGEANSDGSAVANIAQAEDRMNADTVENMPRMRKKRQAMLAKKKRMRGQRRGQSGVDASNTPEEIAEHHSFLVARIDKLKTALEKRTAELKEVMALEVAASDQADDSAKDS